jgi:hypothetical protein
MARVPRLHSETVIFLTAKRSQPYKWANVRGILNKWRDEGYDGPAFSDSEDETGWVGQAYGELLDA